MASSDTRGKAIIKPASFGFCPESQLAKAIIIAASTIFKEKNIINDLNLFKCTFFA